MKYFFGRTQLASIIHKLHYDLPHRHAMWVLILLKKLQWAPRFFRNNLLHTVTWEFQWCHEWSYVSIIHNIEYLVYFSFLTFLWFFAKKLLLLLFFCCFNFSRNRESVFVYRLGIRSGNLISYLSSFDSKLL